MRVEDLKNYGKVFADWTDAESKRIGSAYSKALMKELGLVRSLRLMWKIKTEARRMSHHDWTMLGECMTNQKYMKRSIGGIAAMKAMSDMLGMEKAAKLAIAVVDREGYDAWASVSPTADDYKQCGDAFLAFRDYLKAQFAAEARIGGCQTVIAEENDDMFALRFDRCPLLEIAKAFGNPYLPYPMHCHTDEVYYPRLMKQLGWKFSCTSKAVGAPECTWRIERLSIPTGANNSR